ncbi:MAG: threonine--tRNA ligase [Dermatophilaceae bacterium]
MRLLLIHADRFQYSVTGEAVVTGFTVNPDEADAHGEMLEGLVAFCAVERPDEPGIPDVVAQAVDLIADMATKVGAKAVMVYPYAHLSSDLCKARTASDVLARIEVGLATHFPDLDVQRAPFGYYKSFAVECKGHPLSELARTIHPRPSTGHEADAAPTADEESQALAAEKTLQSDWRIYSPDGSYVPVDEFRLKGAANEGLRHLVAYEREGNRAAEDAPPHIRLMRDHELVDYEPASDTGNLRWYPSGILVKRLLEQHVTAMVTDYGGMEVETPLMYDYEHPALSKYIQRFPARQYRVTSDDKEFFLRFAACFGQYMILSDMVASYRDLPVRLYELTHHSFRREQGGEVAGLRRLRAFTMPDMHSVVADESMAKEEFLEQVKLCLRWIDDIGVDCVPAIRFVKSFLDDHPEFIKDLMALLSRPALVEVWDERFFYFVAKFELNFIDNAKKAACLSTVQIDVENPERFGIDYVDEQNVKALPLLLHTSVSGSVDRNVYALLEHQAKLMSKGQKAEWPTWLAPTQVRLLPVNERHLDAALELAERLPFRVDVDDRDNRLPKKVREAEKEWVPYTIVVGDREVDEGGPLTVRPRTGEQFKATVEELTERLAEEIADKPSRPLNGPRQLTRRPIFVG